MPACLRLPGDRHTAHTGCAALCSLRMFYPSWPWWAKNEMIGGRVGMPLVNGLASELALGKTDMMLPDRPKNKLVWMTLTSMSNTQKECDAPVWNKATESEAARGAAGPRDL